MSDHFSYKPEEAYYGVLGEYLRRTEQHVEVAPLAVLVQLVVALGVMIGRRVFTTGGGPRHHANLYVLVVGKTGIGKGCAWNAAERFCTQIDPDFTKIVHGHPESSPGLIELVSDGVFEGQAGSAGARYVQHPTKDKRCLVVCEEMHAVFTAKSRSGSSLSETLKVAWDGKDLENNTKQPIRATNPHIGLIGHITPEELRDTLPRLRTDRANGFTNRFLLVNLERIRSLPFGGNPPDCSDLCGIIRQRVELLSDETPVEIDFSDDAKPLWELFYAQAQSDTGILPEINGFTERLVPIVKRVAMIFAVLDGEHVINKARLQAAIALCLSALESAGSALPTGRSSGRAGQIGDRIITSFEGSSDWATKKELWKRLGGRGDKDELRDALGELVDSGDLEFDSSLAANFKACEKYRLGPAHRISWSGSAGFSGIDASDYERWAGVFPGVDLKGELGKAAEYLKSNPGRALKGSIAGFITSWLGNAKAGEPAPTPSKEKFYEDAGRSMTAAQHKEWEREQRRTQFLQSKERKRLAPQEVGTGENPDLHGVLPVGAALRQDFRDESHGLISLDRLNPASGDVQSFRSRVRKE